MKRYCLVCQTVFHEQDKKNMYLKCSLCGSCLASHVPNNEIIIKGLNDWANEIVDGENRNSKPSKITYQRVNRLKGIHLLGNKLLDVGCGKADFLLVARKAGFHVSGMDIAEPIIHQLNRYKIHSYRKLSEIKDNIFDVVTCFDVIEHTSDPKKLLKEIYRVTDDNGIVLLSTPNAASLSAKVLRESWWVFGPEGHYVLFTPKSIRIMLEKSGYSHIVMTTNTLTQWMHTESQLINKICNKIIYCVLFPFLPLLFRLGLGDNIEISARKK